MRRLLVLVLALAMALGAAQGAAAQAPDAQPPTPGAPYVDGQSGRYTLDGRWLYRADPGGAGFSQNYAGQTTTDGWTPATAPSTANPGDYSNAAYEGTIAWYRRDFVVPGGSFAPWVASAARRWVVRFESVNYRMNLWLNGVHLGGHTGMNLPFEFSLPPLRSGVNRLVVEVDNRRLQGDMPPGPGAGWWNFGGLLRPVILRRVQVADLTRATISPQLPCPSCPADISESATVTNPTAAPVQVSLTGRFGPVKLDFGSQTIPPHGTWGARARALLRTPRLWSPGSPYLYRATMTLTDVRGRTLAGWTQLSGVRSITVSPDGRLLLNGRALSLRGAEVREQAAGSGTALSTAQLTTLVRQTRALGATLIRSDPLSPTVEELADRYGLLIWSDINVNQQVPKSYLTQPAFNASAQQMLRDDIAANGNHPSLAVWSIGNELPAPPPPSEATYISAMTGLAHSLDPTRPVGMAISNWPGVACQTAYAPLDVIGVNEYFGWFDAGGGSTDDRDALSPYLDTLRSCYPTQGIFVTEFGFDANRTGPADERGTYAFQAQAVADHAHVFDTKPWLAGASYFLLQDAATFPGYSGGDPRPNSPIDAKGLIDMAGMRKPAFNVLSGIFHAAQQIAPSPARGARRARAFMRR